MAGYAILEPLAADFWSRVDRGEANDCWRWQRGRSASGYGQYHLSPASTGLDRWTAIGAHRAAWMLHHKTGLPPKSSGVVVDHRCETKACCNPAHLTLATVSANLRASGGRAIEPLPSGRFKVRFRAGGKQTSRTFDTRDAAAAFELTLRSDTAPRLVGV